MSERNSTRFRRTRAARERRGAPDRFGAAILFLTILVGVALVAFLAFFGLSLGGAG